MEYLGDFKAGSTVELMFDTSADGAPSTLSSVTVKVYKDGSSSTESTTGVTHNEDFDTLTGLNHVTIDLTADAAFYNTGHEFMIVATTATLSGITIRRVLAQFSIENRCVNWAKVVSPTTTVALTGTTVGLLAATITAINAEVVDALATDTYAEPGQGAPGSTVSLAQKIGFLYKFLRNKVTQDATTLKVFADDAATVDQKATVSDDGTTYTRGEIATGP